MEGRVVFSGGGTGGHLFPSLAVGDRLREKDPGLKITFIGSGRVLEKNLMGHYQADFIPLKIEGLKRRGWKSLRALFLLPAAFLKSLRILLRLRPRLVIGAGGYSSGPVVLLAAWMGIPTLIMEQNQRPGFTNRLLRRWVRAAAVSFESTLPEFQDKGIHTGNPVRAEFHRIPPGKREDRLRLMIFGGSQGSRFLNRVITETLPDLEDIRDRLVFRHQTGKDDLDRVRERYAAAGFCDAEVEPFFYDMADKFRDSDLIISRAGATTIAELAAAGRASLLIPFSGAADDHQTLNARELESTGGAEILDEEEFTPGAFRSKIWGFLQDPERISRMEKNLRGIRKIDAAEAIAEICLRLMENSKGGPNG